MSKTAQFASSDSSWPKPTEEASSFFKTPQRHQEGEDYALSSIDEAPDFHDPYSDLNLFLSQKIKQEMGCHGSAKKWSHKIQEELIKKITPDFKKRFPHYRLGIAALKKVWEKIAYYSQQIHQQKEAISQDGKLNIPFFIKENLKNFTQVKPPYVLPPYLHAHQLAVKMSDYIATIDGTRVKLDDLTKMIWSIQRHLLQGLQPHEFKSPYDTYDKIDTLIVKTQLSITAKEPTISQKELEYQVKEAVKSLHDLPSFSSIEVMRCNISALLAEKLYPTSSFHVLFLSQQKNALWNFIRRHAALCKNIPCTSHLPDLVRRMMALYTLASQLPKDVEADTFKTAVSAALYPSSHPKPSLPQAIYAFIAAEAVLMQKEGKPQEEIIHAIHQAYEEAKLLPFLKEKETDLLEMVIWKHLSETEGLLQKLPYLIGQRIEEEIANILIDHPHQTFPHIVLLTVEFFQKTKELTLHKKWADIEQKIYLWSLQGDMICGWIRLKEDTPLFRFLLAQWKDLPSPPPSHQTFTREAACTYLKAHPELAIYLPYLTLRIQMMYKYLWYAHSSTEDSSFDRFLTWHIQELVPHVPEDKIPPLLKELCEKVVPLMPNDF